MDTTLARPPNRLHDSWLIPSIVKPSSESNVERDVNALLERALTRKNAQQREKFSGNNFRIWRPLPLHRLESRGSVPAGPGRASPMFQERPSPNLWLFGRAESLPGGCTTCRQRAANVGPACPCSPCSTHVRSTLRARNSFRQIIVTRNPSRDSTGHSALGTRALGLTADVACLRSHVLAGVRLHKRTSSEVLQDGSQSYRH